MEEKNAENKLDPDESKICEKADLVSVHPTSSINSYSPIPDEESKQDSTNITEANIGNLLHNLISKEESQQEETCTGAHLEETAPIMSLQLESKLSDTLNTGDEVGGDSVECDNTPDVADKFVLEDSSKKKNDLIKSQVDTVENLDPSDVASSKNSDLESLDFHRTLFDVMSERSNDKSDNVTSDIELTKENKTEEKPSSIDSTNAQDGENEIRISPLDDDLITFDQSAEVDVAPSRSQDTEEEFNACTDNQVDEALCQESFEDIANIQNDLESEKEKPGETISNIEDGFEEMVVDDPIEDQLPKSDALLFGETESASNESEVRCIASVPPDEKGGGSMVVEETKSHVLDSHDLSQVKECEESQINCPLDIPDAVKEKRLIDEVHMTDEISVKTAETIVVNEIFHESVNLTIEKHESKSQEVKNIDKETEIEKLVPNVDDSGKELEKIMAEIEENTCETSETGALQLDLTSFLPEATEDKHEACIPDMVVSEPMDCFMSDLTEVPKGDSKDKISMLTSADEDDSFVASDDCNVGINDENNENISEVVEEEKEIDRKSNDFQENMETDDFLENEEEILPRSEEFTNLQSDTLSSALDTNLELEKIEKPTTEPAEENISLVSQLPVSSSTIKNIDDVIIEISSLPQVSKESDIVNSSEARDLSASQSPLPPTEHESTTSPENMECEVAAEGEFLKIERVKEGEEKPPESSFDELESQLISTIEGDTMFSNNEQKKSPIEPMDVELTQTLSPLSNELVESVPLIPEEKIFESERQSTPVIIEEGALLEQEQPNSSFPEKLESNSTLPIADETAETFPEEEVHEEQESASTLTEETVAPSAESEQSKMLPFESELLSLTKEKTASPQPAEKEVTSLLAEVEETSSLLCIEQEHTLTSSTDKQHSASFIQEQSSSPHSSNTEEPASSQLEKLLSPLSELNTEPEPLDEEPRSVIPTLPTEQNTQSLLGREEELVSLPFREEERLTSLSVEEKSASPANSISTEKEPKSAISVEQESLLPIEEKPTLSSEDSQESSLLALDTSLKLAEEETSSSLITGMEEDSPPCERLQEEPTPSTENSLPSSVLAQDTSLNLAEEETSPSTMNAMEEDLPACEQLQDEPSGSTENSIPLTQESSLLALDTSSKLAVLETLPSSITAMEKDLSPCEQVQKEPTGSTENSISLTQESPLLGLDTSLKLAREETSHSSITAMEDDLPPNEQVQKEPTSSTENSISLTQESPLLRLDTSLKLAGQETPHSSITEMEEDLPPNEQVQKEPTENSIPLTQESPLLRLDTSLKLAGEETPHSSITEMEEDLPPSKQVSSSPIPAKEESASSPVDTSTPMDQNLLSLPFSERESSSLMTVEFEEKSSVITEQNLPLSLPFEQESSSPTPHEVEEQSTVNTEQTLTDHNLSSSFLSERVTLATTADEVEEKSSVNIEQNLSSSFCSERESASPMSVDIEDKSAVNTAQTIMEQNLSSSLPPEQESSLPMANEVEEILSIKTEETPTEQDLPSLLPSEQESSTPISQEVEENTETVSLEHLPSSTTMPPDDEPTKLAETIESKPTSLEGKLIVEEESSSIPIVNESVEEESPSVPSRSEETPTVREEATPMQSSSEQLNENVEVSVKILAEESVEILEKSKKDEPSSLADGGNSADPSAQEKIRQVDEEVKNQCANIDRKRSIRKNLAEKAKKRKSVQIADSRIEESRHTNTEPMEVDSAINLNKSSLVLDTSNDESPSANKNTEKESVQIVKIKKVKKQLPSAVTQSKNQSRSEVAEDVSVIEPDATPVVAVQTRRRGRPSLNEAKKRADVIVDSSKSNQIEVTPESATPRSTRRSTRQSIEPPSTHPSSDEPVVDVETITGMVESEVCISPDTSLGRRTRRSIDDSVQQKQTTSRPKRSAARAADSKIKSLVMNALEPVSLEEVDEPVTQQCSQCKRTKLCRFQASGHTLCSEDCHAQWTSQSSDTPVRACAQCRGELPREGPLSWETMDFCREDCLETYQKTLGSHCAYCNNLVSSSSVGKFCVRFGYDIKQFCAPSCLEEYKKGLKVCSYCQKDISGGAEGFLAPVGDKGQFKNFCSQSCMGKYEQMSGACPNPEDVSECAVCSHSKPVKIEVVVGAQLNKLCSEPCFAAFKFVNNISEGRCDQCKKFFDKVQAGRLSVYFEDKQLNFCCKTCLNVYVLANRKIVPCGHCKVKKYNFDMIKKVQPAGGSIMACSLACLAQCQAGAGSRRLTCDSCASPCHAQYKLPFSDGSTRQFCSYNCTINFQKRLSGKSMLPPKPVVQVASRGVKTQTIPTSDASTIHLNTQAVQNGPPPLQPISLPPPPPQIYQHILTKPAERKESKNKSILCKPYMHNKGTSCRPMPCYKSTQTDESLSRKCLIPIPVPIYVPAPMHMYTSPCPMPVPFPLPVPVPIFIPTTRNSAKGIFREIKKIQEKIPTDPFEAELLMMAEMVAGEKKQDPTDSESDDGAEADVGAETFSPEPVDTSNAFGEDVLQMALKMASELEEPAVDMESVLTPSTITPAAQPTVDSKNLYAADPDDPTNALAMARGRKRPLRISRGGGQQSKRGRRSGSDGPNMPPPEAVQPARIEVEKPDANMCLKYTFGVNAWRHWVMQKNAELEKAALTNRKIKPFKPELLQLTSDELNFSLCLFVKEVKKPNGQEYAPDTIYYLCLGIQQYLFENGRIDNIFTDAYYEKFTDCLDEVAKKFAVLYNDSQFIVTRVEEEHLWESKQLGAHSPHVLLSTLMFFNTKHFNLVTVEEHMQLSFSHIMKHWKRNPNTPGVAKVPGSRNVLLRFYPPQSALEANSKKKKVYEQQENEENPLRCPVKLYEFYLSKCPESVKTRNDVFYLLPERSCVPDSPVWYSTMALGKEPLMKMLHRIKMVKEINVALITC